MTKTTANTNRVTEILAQKRDLDAQVKEFAKRTARRVILKFADETTNCMNEMMGTSPFVDGRGFAFRFGFDGGNNFYVSYLDGGTGYEKGDFIHFSVNYGLRDLLDTQDPDDITVIWNEDPSKTVMKRNPLYSEWTIIFAIAEMVKDAALWRSLGV